MRRRNWMVVAVAGSTLLACDDGLDGATGTDRGAGASPTASTSPAASSTGAGGESCTQWCLGACVQLPKAGGAPIVLATTRAGYGAVAVDATDVYFHSAAGVARVPKAGGAPTVIDPSAISIFGALDVDATHVYYPNAAGFVKRSLK